MRVYGSSPLYNYVELIFRCKRMFIVAVIVGAIVSSVMVYTRPVSYNASMVVSLTGQTGLAAMAGDSEPADPNAPNPVRRKANRLVVWMSSIPKFMEQVVTDATLDKKHKDKTVEQLANEVRSHLGQPAMLSDQYMRLDINWPREDEAKDILSALYSRFANWTVDVETIRTTDRRKFLEKQYGQAEATADALARKRIIYLRQNFFEQPSMLSSLVGQIDQGQRQIEDARVDLVDAQSRLSDIDRQLQSVPQRIDSGGGVVTMTEDPTKALRDQLTALQGDRAKLLQTYSDQHPKVKAIQAQIDAIQGQIQAAGQTPAPIKAGEQSHKDWALNPEYQDLTQQKRELERVVHAQQRRVDELQKNVDLAKSRAQKLPDQEVISGKIEREYQLASTIRNNAEAKLAAAKLDEQADREANQKAVGMEVPPSAERADTGGKTLMLYALGPIMGIFIAFCFSLLVETLDHTLRTPVEVEKYLGKPVLAVIPKMKAPRGGPKQLPGSSTTSISS